MIVIIEPLNSNILASWSMKIVDEESIMNLIRKEVEKCDSLSGFFIIMSMAGGTGSGLGAFVTQNLQDQYSSALKMNQIIWPYGTGEV